jgi:hypothetical protein
LVISDIVIGDRFAECFTEGLHDFLNGDDVANQGQDSGVRKERALKYTRCDTRNIFGGNPHGRRIAPALARLPRASLTTCSSEAAQPIDNFSAKSSDAV